MLKSTTIQKKKEDYFQILRDHIAATEALVETPNQPNWTAVHNSLATAKFRYDLLMEQIDGECFMESHRKERDLKQGELAKAVKLVSEHFQNNLGKTSTTI